MDSRVGGGGECKAFKYKKNSLYDFFLLFPFFGQCLISGSVLLIYRPFKISALLKEDRETVGDQLPNNLLECGTFQESFSWGKKN